jgi:hypothetical protein
MPLLKRAATLTLRKRLITLAVWSLMILLPKRNLLALVPLLRITANLAWRKRSMPMIHPQVRTLHHVRQLQLLVLVGLRREVVVVAPRQVKMTLQNKAAQYDPEGAIITAPP